MSTLRLIGLVVAMSIMVSPSYSQPSAAVAGMTVRFMSWEGEMSDLWVADGSAFLPARAGEFVLGRAIALTRRSSAVRLFREQIVEGVVRKVLVADVPWPGGATSALVVLAAAPAGSSLPLQGRALDQSLEVQPLETIRIVNFSGKTIALRLGENTAELAPGREEQFPFPAVSPSQVTVELAVREADGWGMVQRSLQPAPPGRRILGVVRDGRPDFAIQDLELRTKPVDAIFLIDRAAPPAVAVVDPK